MPYQLYIDESGTPADEIFVIAGVAVRDEDWSSCERAWYATLDRSNRPRFEEVHWHALAGRGSQNHDRDAQLLDALFSLLAKLPLTCLAVAIKSDAARKKRPDLFGASDSPHDDELMYREALAWLLERYQRVLDHSGSYGSVLLDSRARRSDPTKDEALFLRIKQWLRDGRSGTSPEEHLALVNLLESIRFADSRDQIGLQVADLVAGCTRRALSSADRNAARWYAKLEPRFARHPTLDDVDGTGLVRWPRSHNQHAKPQNDLPAFER
jgi:hypothetical protein